MATDNYNLSAVHQVNKWLWARLKAELASDFTAYTTSGQPAYNLVPIIPSQQMPAFNNIAGGAPFMIYNYSIEGGDEVYMQQEQAGWVIYDDNEARLRRIHTFMFNLLRRLDWTAADINKYLDALAASTGKPNEFDFKSVTVNNAAGPQPFETEGGRHGAVVMTTIKYTHDLVGDMGMLGNGLGMRT